MSEINSKLFKDDPATYYTGLGAQAEQERIVKLLESDLDVLPEFARAIELIKGEQK